MRITKRQLRRLIEQTVIDKTVPEHFGGGENIDVYGYETKNFDVCSTATELFGEELSGAKFPGTECMIIKAARVADKIFGLEKRAVRKGTVTYDEAQDTRDLYEEFKDRLRDIFMSDYGDKVAFMKMHVKEITKRER